MNNDLFNHPKHRLIELLIKNNSSALSHNNKITLLTEIKTTNEMLIKDIKKAKFSIYIEYYIIEDGIVLNTLLDLLTIKIKEGLLVYLIYDAFGSRTLSSKTKARFKSIGIQTKAYMPLNMSWQLRYLNYRNHRKLTLIDEAVAYLGGMNISDNYNIPTKKLGLWKDVSVRIEGNASMDIANVFKCDWLNAGGKTIHPIHPKLDKQTTGNPLQIVVGGPDSDYMSILHEYFTLITDATNYVYILTPYFVPIDTIITALKTSALSGIDVRIMLPFASDSKWLKWCTFTYIKELLRSGVRVYLYHDGFLHGKVIISDDLVTSIGSANLDERSFTSNFELNAVIYSKDITLQTKSYFLKELEASEELLLENFDERVDRNKTMEVLARITSPVL